MFTAQHAQEIRINKAFNSEVINFYQCVIAEKIRNAMMKDDYDFRYTEVDISFSESENKYVSENYGKFKDLFAALGFKFRLRTNSTANIYWP